VVSLKQAYILNLFSGQGYPEIKDVLVYQPKRGWGLIDDNSYACVENEWLCTSDIDPAHIQVVMLYLRLINLIRLMN
jgi:ribonuclease J